MIKIGRRAVVPPVLAANAVQWRDELLAHIAAGRKVPDALASAYNHPEVKDALREDGRRKCMYCEGAVDHVAYEHIEHYRPKAKNKYPQLTYDWTNLGLACPACNTNKSDDFDESWPHVNPYVEEPADFFVAAGPMVFAKTGNKRAEVTAESVKFNRPGLIEKRAERMASLQLLLKLYSDEQNQMLKDVWKRRIKEEIDVDREFSFCLREFVALQLGRAFIN